MRNSRRSFVGGALGAGAAGLAHARAASGPDPADLDRTAALPVLKLEGFTTAVIIESLGRCQEYKLGLGVYGSWIDPPITVKDGKMTVPSGPGVRIKDLRALLNGAVDT